MYLCFKLHHITPSAFIELGICEKIILKNCIEQELEEMNQQNSGGDE